MAAKVGPAETIIARVQSGHELTKAEKDYLIKTDVNKYNETVRMEEERKAGIEKTIEARKELNVKVEQMLDDYKKE